MPRQGLEIQASASSRASPFGSQAWGVAAPFPQLLASCPQWKTLRRGCWGAAGGLLGWVCPPTERCLVPWQRVLRKASFTPSPCWGANGGVLMGSCLPGGTADGKCNQKGLFSWLYTSAEAWLGTRWRGQDQGLCLCKVTAGGGAEGHSGCQHCPGCQGRLRRPPSRTPKPP